MRAGVSVSSREEAADLILYPLWRGHPEPGSREELVTSDQPLSKVRDIPESSRAERAGSCGLPEWRQVSASEEASQEGRARGQAGCGRAQDVGRGGRGGGLHCSRSWLTLRRTIPEKARALSGSGEGPLEALMAARPQCPLPGMAQGFCLQKGWPGSLRSTSLLMTKDEVQPSGLPASWPQSPLVPSRGTESLHYSRMAPPVFKACGKTALKTLSGSWGQQSSGALMRPLGAKHGIIALPLLSG